MRLLAVLLAKLLSEMLGPKFQRRIYSSICKERSSERILSLWVIKTASISDKIWMSSKYYIFWDVKECSLVNVYRCFGRTNCHHHQVWWNICRKLKTGTVESRLCWRSSRQGGEVRRSTSVHIYWGYTAWHLRKQFWLLL